MIILKMCFRTFRTIITFNQFMFKLQWGFLLQDKNSTQFSLAKYSFCISSNKKWLDSLLFLIPPSFNWPYEDVSWVMIEWLTHIRLQIDIGHCGKCQKCRPKFYCIKSRNQRPSSAHTIDRLISFAHSPYVLS